MTGQLKATGKVPHTGGLRFSDDGVYYKTLLQWIEAGTPDDSENVATPVEITLQPERIQFVVGGKAAPTKVTACDSDGSTRDVTNLALFQSNHPETATVDRDGVVTPGTRGDTYVFARFNRFMVGAKVIVLPEGILPFPEGMPQVIRFNRNGAILMVAGGKPVRSGRVVLFDVRSGKRLAEIGDEIDTVMAADLSPDQKVVAIGGSGEVIKIYDTTNGSLKFKLTQHTDWMTSIAFSPDGAKLATADRSGGLHIWDTMNGGILLTLAEHKSSVTSLHWRGDSRVLVSAGEDGNLIWWDTVDGWPAITKNNAHPPKRPDGYDGNLRNGVLSAAFGTDGTLLSAGRDHVVRYWSPAGNVQKSFDNLAAIPLATCISNNGKTLVTGDAAGNLHFYQP